MDEKKQYSVVGQVTIGTDEYRDLIEAKLEAEKDRDDYRGRYWHEQDVSKKANEKVEAQKKALDLYKEFIAGDAERLNAYKLFILTKRGEQYDEA